MKLIDKYITPILPGLFLIGYVVGTGSVTAMSKAGANFGLELLWTLAISCIITYFLMVHFAKFTSVTGLTAIQGMRDHIHPLLAKVLIVALSLIILSALMGVLGIMSDVLQLWSGVLFKEAISDKIWAVVIATILMVVLWKGNTSIFEKILSVLVAVMGIAFIATTLKNFPSATELVKGFIPSMPKASQGSNTNSLIILTSMVGTTASVFVFIIRSQIAQEKGWTIADSKLQRRDAKISASLMFIVSAAVLITAAGTLYVQGIRLNNVPEMVTLMVPIAGKAAMIVFVIGIIAAGISSHLPNLLVIPWLIIDYKSEKRDTTKPKYRFLLLILSIISVSGILFGFKPIFIMLMSQASQTITMPILVGSIIYLTSSKKLMGEHTNNKRELFILGLVMLFSLYIGYEGLVGIVTTFI